MFINKLLSGIIQILLFSFIPALWWFITARKKVNFFRWIGLKKWDSAVKQNSGDIFFLGMIVSSIFFILTSAIMRNLDMEKLALSEFKGLGISALPAAVVYSVLNTALSEEIFFRGFLLKRLSHQFGFQKGNLTQAALFGLLHGIVFFPFVSISKLILISLFTGLIGWSMGWINQIKARGSILPSWGIHAVANLLSAFISMFDLSLFEFPRFIQR